MPCRRAIAWLLWSERYERVFQLKNEGENGILNCVGFKDLAIIDDRIYDRERRCEFMFRIGTIFKA